MEQEIKYERPNTVSGLLAKHKELTGLLERHKTEIRKIKQDMMHLEATILLFDPDAQAERALMKRKRAPRGKIKYFILSALREAPEPMTSRQLAEQWAAEEGLETDDKSINGLRKRITYSIKDAVKQGIVECAGRTINHGQYGPYKLWRVVCD